MHHISFGSVLKEARIAKGLDIASVSRELRIRQDIIIAIEKSDFARMPSRGYARNMIIAYARLVGLNPQDVSRMYLDQEYAYQVEQAHRSVSNTLQMQRDTSSRIDSYSDSASQFKFDSSYDQDRRGSLRSRSRTMVSNDLNDTAYSSDHRRGARSSDNTQAMRTQTSQSTHRSRRSAMTEGKYTNLYSAPSNIPQPNQKRNRLIVLVVGVIVVVILLCALFLSHCGSSDTQTNIPVTGAESTTSQDPENESDTKTKTETAPTEFTFTYKVADGSESYIEVYIDEKTQESSTVTGPQENTYTCSSTLRFVSTETKGVTATINGEEVELTSNSNGIVNQTYTFEDILNQWYEDHPDAKRSDTSSSTKSNSDSSSDSKSSSSTDSSDSDSTSE